MEVDASVDMHNNAPPQILAFSCTPTTATEGDSVSFTLELANDERLADVASAELFDTDGGGSYGALEPTGTPGVFVLTRTWAEMQSVRSIDFSEPLPRGFTARVVGRVGQSASANLSVLLTCNGRASCAGSCTDLMSTQHCGACGNECSVTGWCDDAHCRDPIVTPLRAGASGPGRLGVTIGHDDVVHTVYYDASREELTLGALHDSSWTFQRLLGEPDRFAVADPNIAVNSHDQAHALFLHNGEVTYAMPSGTTFAYETVAADSRIREDLSFAFDSSDQPHVSYTTTTLDAKTRLTYATRVTGTWTTEEVALFDQENYAYSALAVSESGVPSIVYFERGANAVMVATRDEGVWTKQQVEAGIAQSESAAAYDSAGVLHVAYSIGGVLRHATRAVGASAWSTTQIDPDHHADFVYIRIGPDDTVYLVRNDAAHAVTFIELIGETWSTHTVPTGDVQPSFMGLAVDSHNTQHLILSGVTGAEPMQYVSLGR